MRKKEFLRKLSYELSDMSKSERNDILNYYDELIEDRIETTGKSETVVIHELGDIEGIARRVNPNTKYVIRYDEDEKIKRNKNSRSSDKSTWQVISTIILLPVWCILIILQVALMIAVFFTSLGIFAAGAYSIIVGSIALNSTLTMGLFEIGLGILIIGAMLLLVPIIAKIIFGLIKLLKNFLRLISGRRTK